jgi:ribonuclease HII
MVSNSGKQAEKVAAEYLEKQGYKILAKNWRTRMCEIDIVASKDKCVYFVEVKYRKSLDWGSGLDYITSAKQKQMNFAAEMWLSQNKWSGECSLAALEVAGEDYQVTSFLTEI